MSIRKVTSQAFSDWVESLIKMQKVYGVQAKGERFAFDELQDARDLRLDYDVTILPPKKYFQPAKETLFEFTRTGTFTSVFEADPFILLGVHPYDMAALNQMDRIFSMNQYDAHYMKRREQATVVVSDPQQASPTVFATSMGHATTENMTGFDMLLTQLDDGSWLADARTDKGEALLAPLGEAPQADGDDLQQRDAVWQRNRGILDQQKLKMDPEEIPDLLEKGYNHHVWDLNATMCYSCGSCNLVCPTCYCFDVQDEWNWDMESGHRYRTWDGCMLTGFARVAGNHDFRPKRSARYRHRFMRKGRFVFDILGELSCVGCGRCAAACTVNISSPVEVFNTLWEDQQ